MYSLKKFILYSGYIFISFFSFAQNRFLDAGARVSFITKYNINSKNYLSLMLRLKEYENFTELSSGYVGIVYGYKLSSSLKFSVRYLIGSKITNSNYYRNIYRYYFRLDYRYFLNKYITIRNAVIFQHATQRFITDIQDNGYKPYLRTNFRERLGLVYNFSSTTNIYLYDEIMYTLSENPVELKRNRIYLGYEKQFNNKWTTTIYFALQSYLHKTNSPNYLRFIIGWDWTLDLN